VAEADVIDPAGKLDGLANRLHPSRNRAEVLSRLDEAFRSGDAPDPLPSGFRSGRLLATSTWGPWDSLVQRLAGLWMPWLGKSFDAASETGINRFLPTPGTRLLLRLLFPTHVPAVSAADRIEAFPFRTRVAPGEIDPAVRVLKIDYDFEANPTLIRRILDEVVKVAPGLFLGKVLFRLGQRYHRIGFFSLRA